MITLQPGNCSHTPFNLSPITALHHITHTHHHRRRRNRGIKLSTKHLALQWMLSVGSCAWPHYPGQLFIWMEGWPFSQKLFQLHKTVVSWGLLAFDLRIKANSPWLKASCLLQQQQAGGWRWYSSEFLLSAAAAIIIVPAAVCWLLEMRRYKSWQPN